MRPVRTTAMRPAPHHTYTYREEASPRRVRKRESVPRRPHGASATATASEDHEELDTAEWHGQRFEIMLQRVLDEVKPT